MRRTKTRLCLLSLLTAVATVTQQKVTGPAMRGFGKMDKSDAGGVERQQKEKSSKPANNFGVNRTTELGIGVQPPGLGKLVADLRGILKIGGTVVGIELSHSWTLDGGSTNDMEWKGAMALLIQHQYGK